MAVTVYLSGHLKDFTGGVTEVGLDRDFAAVGEVLDSLWGRFPALRDRVLNEQGGIRKNVKVFEGGRDVKQVEGLATKVRDKEIHIFNAVSGG